MFAQVEQLDDPRLQGRPVLVGGTGRRAVVAAASVEAKRAGVRSAMPMGMATRMLPTFVVVAPRFSRYQEVSREVMTRLVSFAVDGLVEQVSIDEAFLAIDGDPVTTAHRIRRAVLDAVGVTISLGVADTKLAAKLLSTWTKREHGPGTVGHMAGRALLDWMGTLPVRALPGCGPVAADKLGAIGVETVADLRRTQEPLVRRALGTAAAHWLVEAAHNRDNRVVSRPGERKQVSQERTFGEDLLDLDEITAQAVAMAQEVAAALARKGRFARTGTVKLRTEDFEDVSRSRTLAVATSDAAHLAGLATDLADTAWDALANRPIRLVGFSASNLTTTVQDALW